MSENFVDILGELRINGVNPFGYKPPLKIASVALRGEVNLPAKAYKTIPYNSIRYLDKNLVLNDRGGIVVNTNATFAIVIVRQRVHIATDIYIGVQTNNNPLHSITNQLSGSYGGFTCSFLLPVTTGDVIYTSMYSNVENVMYGSDTDIWFGMDIILI